MTPAQDDAFKRIDEIMREHFEAGVIVVKGEHTDKTEDIRSTWHGGYATSIGLLEMGKLHAWHASSRMDDDES
jgi:hypothetical protein